MLLRRKLTLLSLLMLSAVLCMAATAQSFLMRAAAEKSFPAVEEKYTSFETAAYILREQDGYVAVFSSNGSQLLETTAIPVSTLREADRYLLESGIAADSRETMLKLLEDFNS
ncbi:MAG: hypothetical protein IJD81_01210 [Oscillospiraceae bacterium]|nr:hypothetical protein [Oscillospiraceae bacterium]